MTFAQDYLEMVFSNSKEKVTEIFISGKGLKGPLSLEEFPNLEKLYCSYNKITCLTFCSSNKLKILYCNSNNLKILDDLHKLTKLEVLDCSCNYLSKIDFSSNFLLNRVYCNFNELKFLDFPNNPLLSVLHCCNNDLFFISTEKNPNLLQLSCSYNKLENLILSENVELTEVYCGSNLLKNLELSKNVNLRGLSCDYNSLVEINLPNWSPLKVINFSNNFLTSLNLLNFGNDLIFVACENNSSLSEDFLLNVDSDNLWSFLINGTLRERLFLYKDFPSEEVSNAELLFRYQKKIFSLIELEYIYLFFLQLIYEKFIFPEELIYFLRKYYLSLDNNLTFFTKGFLYGNLAKFIGDETLAKNILDNQILVRFSHHW